MARPRPTGVHPGASLPGGVAGLGALTGLPTLDKLLSGGFKAGQLSLFTAGMRSGKSMLGMRLMLDDVRRREEEARRLAERIKQLDDAFPQVDQAPARLRM